MIAVDRYRDVCDINSMRRDTQKVYTTKSESRFFLYELKSMVKQGDIGTFLKNLVKKGSKGGRSPDGPKGLPSPRPSILRERIISPYFTHKMDTVFERIRDE